MRIHHLAAALACGAAIASASAAGNIEYGFVNPERFTDLGIEAVDRNKALRTLEEHFEKMADRLPDGQVLRLEFLDIDLAGSLDMNLRRGGTPIRMLNGGRDAPQIKLRYSLRANGALLKSGDVELVNPNYLDNRRPYYLGSNELPHERRMLDDWLTKTILAP